MDNSGAEELIEFLEDGAAALEAKKLFDQKYITISNKYCMIGKPDTDDWHIVLAKQMRCAPANFFVMDGSGSRCPQWREHYIRVVSEDTRSIDEKVFRHLKRLINAAPYSYWRDKTPYVDDGLEF